MNYLFNDLLRAADIRKNYRLVPKEAGLYRWWFAKEDSQILLQSLNDQLELDRISTRDIDGKEYWALYLGKAKKIKERIREHISGRHIPRMVHKGFLSTLRKTISALLKLDMLLSEKAVNEVIDRAYVEFCVLPLDEVPKAEVLCINSGYYPLNDKENHQVRPEVIKIIEQLRSEHKK